MSSHYAHQQSCCDLLSLYSQPPIILFWFEEWIYIYWTAVPVSISVSVSVSVLGSKVLRDLFKFRKALACLPEPTQPETVADHSSCLVATFQQSTSSNHLLSAHSTPSLCLALLLITASLHPSRPIPPIRTSLASAREPTYNFLIKTPHDDAADPQGPFPTTTLISSIRTPTRRRDRFIYYQTGEFAPSRHSAVKG